MAAAMSRMPRLSALVPRKGACGSLVSSNLRVHRVQKRKIANHVKELFTLRQRLVVKNQSLCRRIGLLLGHGGYLVGLLEYGVTEMALLRIFAMTGAGLIVGWQLLQPKVQWVTGFWNLVYSAVNFYQLMRLQSQSLPPPELTWEEKRLHAQLGGDQPGRLTVRQFKDLMELGEWQWLVDGALLSSQRVGEDDRCIYFITVGQCEVFQEDRPLMHLGAGSTVGEAGLFTDEVSGTLTLPETAEAAPTTQGDDVSVVACGSVRCFAVPMGKVRLLLEADPSMKIAMAGVFAETFAAQLAALNLGAKERNYRAVLEVACLLHDQDGVADGVQAYRDRYGIQDHVHMALIEELPQCVHKPFRSTAVATKAVPSIAVENTTASMD